MTTRINITGIKDIIDPYYRYKMDRYQVIRLKNKTVVSNFGKVATDIARDPKSIADFIKKKIGTTLALKNGELTLTKDITQLELTTYLREYIQKYVLCGKCNNPETTLDAGKKSCKFN